MQALERELYNEALRLSMMQGINRAWKDDNFVALYSARASTLYTHLDPDSPIVQTHGDELAQRLLKGHVQCADIARLSAQDLCAEAFRNEKTLAHIRSQQKVELKVSSWWVCPNRCKIRACTYQEVQVRSLDEPANIYCVCTQCGISFRGA